MDLTKKHIARRKRMESARGDMFKEKNKIESAYRAKVARDTKADKELFVKCYKVYCNLMEEERECGCDNCNPRIAPSYDCSLNDEGTFNVYYGADHPNDRRYDDYSISKLLKEEK